MAGMTMGRIGSWRPARRCRHLGMASHLCSVTVPIGKYERLVKGAIACNVDEIKRRLATGDKIEEIRSHIVRRLGDQKND